MTASTLSSEPPKEQRRNAIIACIIAALAIGSTIPSAYEPFTRSTSWEVYANLLSGVLPTLAWLVGLYFVLRNRIELGVQIGLIVSLIAIPLTSYWMQGVALANAVAVGVGATIIAGVCLRPSLSRWYMLAGIGAAFATVLIDYLAPRPRLISEQDAFLINAVTFLAISGLLVFLFFQFPRYSLRTKLIILFVGLTLLSTLAVTIVASEAIRNSLIEIQARDLRTRAQAAALAIGITMDRNVDRLQTMSLDKQVQDNVTLIADSYPVEQSERDAMLARNTERWASANAQDSVIRNVLNGELTYSLRQFGDVFQGNKELFMTDRYGAVIAATDWQPIYNFAENDWWQIAYNNGRGSVYVGQPEFNPMLNDYGVRIALPIYAPGRTRVVGILHSVFTLAALQRALLYNSFGQSGKIDLLFPQGQLLTSDGTFRALTAEEFAQVKDGLAQSLATLTYRGSPLLSSQAIVGTSDEQAEPFLRSSAWRTIATIEASEALAAVNTGAQAALVAGIATIGAAILLALVLAQLLTRPIRRLTLAAEQVQSGDLSARARVETGDEIGVLAQTFNSMTARLQDTLSGLERRVIERTQELSQANLALQSNSAYLSALSDTSAGLFERLELRELLHAILERSGALFGTPNGFVFFAEPGDPEIQMRVGSGLYDDLVGTRASRGVGLAGTVWQSGESMSIDDYQEWEGRLPGSRRDALHSIVAVPLKRGAGQGGADDETVGVIGLAYTEEKRKFGKNEVEILQRFAQLASIALDNAELYSASENRVKELGALNEISTLLISDKPLTERLSEVGMELHAIFGVSSVYIALYDAADRLVRMPFFLDDHREYAVDSFELGPGFASHIIQTCAPLLINEDMDAQMEKLQTKIAGVGAVNESYLGVPIVLGDEVLGVIGLSDVPKNKFHASDVRLLQTIASAIAAAIQNTRLLEQTQERARELDAVNSLAREITQQRSLDDLFQEVYLQVKSVTVADGMIISLYDDRTDTLTVPFLVDEGKRYAITPDALEFERSYADQVRRGEPLLINSTPEQVAELETSPALAGTGRASRSRLYVPLMAGVRFLGMISLHSYAYDAYSQRDAAVLSGLASHIAIALENARLFEQTQSALAETQRSAARERVAAEQVMALNRRLTREGWRDYLEQLNSRFVVEAAELENEQGGAHQHSNGGTNGHDRVQVPIVLRGEVIGEIELEPEDTATPMSEDDLGLVTQVAENIGLALDNARLYTETQRRVTELDALNHISQAVTTELQLDSLLSIIGDQVRTIFDVQNAYIALYDNKSGMITLPYLVSENEHATVPAMPFGEGITSQIIRAREPLVINNNTAQEMTERGAKTIGNPARSYLGVPIIVGEDVTGVISIQNTQREGVFNESDVRLLETIAATVGAAIQSAQLYGAMQQEVITRQRAEEEIKLSLREKEVLLKEIHHRVKNNLQIITSLLNLQSAQLKDPEAISLFRESQSRVRSMALIHEKLYQSKDLARIDFDGYVRDLIVYLFRSYAANPDQIRPHISTHEIYLGIDIAIPCGLIISELVTNSLKYGFPDGKRGDIHVNLGPEDDGHLTLWVKDTGVGFSEGFDWRTSDSLGLQLVSTLTAQLHGVIDVHSNGGTSFKITFPG